MKAEISTSSRCFECHGKIEPAWRPNIGERKSLMVKAYDLKNGKTFKLLLSADETDILREFIGE